MLITLHPSITVHEIWGVEVEVFFTFYGFCMGLYSVNISLYITYSPYYSHFPSTPLSQAVLGYFKGLFHQLRPKMELTHFMDDGDTICTYLHTVDVING